jgi:Tfp pilus assembly protein PilO
MTNLATPPYALLVSFVAFLVLLFCHSFLKRHKLKNLKLKETYKKKLNKRYRMKEKDKETLKETRMLERLGKMKYHLWVMTE